MCGAAAKVCRGCWMTGEMEIRSTAGGGSWYGFVLVLGRCSNCAESAIAAQRGLGEAGKIDAAAVNDGQISISFPATGGEKHCYCRR